MSQSLIKNMLPNTLPKALGVLCCSAILFGGGCQKNAEPSAASPTETQDTTMAATESHSDADHSHDEHSDDKHNSHDTHAHDHSGHEHDHSGHDHETGDMTIYDCEPTLTVDAHYEDTDAHLLIDGVEYELSLAASADTAPVDTRRYHTDIGLQKNMGMIWQVHEQSAQLYHTPLSADGDSIEMTAAFDCQQRT